ncbi:TetR/AcrR family transcriptional regulator [Paenibacillus nasutitermitis]|uniref:Transcriptional regulator, TetR family protein n=1 Tax=Paenibacillus nasutitermitis TaxID=1652958 RepID=A0A916Z749_9BACL|nr:TetR/AcrR family transcriptional regulator [Paenibacillus nasutitermitis]GGD79626.1 putative transcriptional regulator, TetR family protein [Paenibacillus nasutitermitis]
MPRSREENARIRQLTMTNIGAAAMEIFLERGYHASSIGDIAKRADVAKGLIYNYYQGKEGLLAEIVHSRMIEIAEVIKDASLLPSAGDQIRRIVEGALGHVERNPKAYRFILHLQTQPEEDIVLSKYSEMLNREMSKQFEVQCEIFQRMGVDNPELRSLYFSSTLHGIMLLKSVYPSYPVEEMKAQIIRDFCQE